MESFQRSSYSFNVNNYSFSNSVSIVPRFPGHIGIILKLFAVFGIDIILTTKGKKNRIINKVSVIVYRCAMSLIMLYCLAARLYKASQPNVPFMLAFSESVATACSVVIRFTILLNKSSIVRIVRSLQKPSTEGTRRPNPSQIRQEKVLFRFGTGGVLFALCLSVTKAVFELRSAAGFQIYKKAYLFSPQISNQTLIFTAPNVFVCTSHVFYIANLYGVPGLSLMFCCVICQNVTFFLRDFQTKARERFESGEPQKILVRNIIFYLKKMRSLVNKTENALSPILFFLYGYLLCSLFYLVSLTIIDHRILSDRLGCLKQRPSDIPLRGNRGSVNRVTRLDPPSTTPYMPKMAFIVKWASAPHLITNDNRNILSEKLLLENKFQDIGLRVSSGRENHRIKDKRYWNAC
ncbi:uncharacterized protein TNCV_544461 [Trichonephila clavipes]|nr:uncharacterized protein TNCV_544461 [Trichonephila clavipes]